MERFLGIDGAEMMLVAILPVFAGEANGLGITI
jgi:hypothetical protein